LASIEETLRVLRDVQGVYGSFVVADSGALIARDLPSVYDGELFAEVGPRVARLTETLRDGGDQLDACMLRFAQHKLYIRRITWGLIGIMAAIGVNMPALRMVSNLVIRRIDPEIVAASPPSTFLPSLHFPSNTQPALASRPPTPPPRLSPLPTIGVESPLAPAPSLAATGPARPDAVEIVAQDGRDSTPPTSERHVRMYRGRRLEE
jgi:predicted regulator of Ras-like GTPase activity (Roadblock/LC7/MglB family)